MLNFGFGPFVLAINHLIMLAALAIALASGWWLARRRAAPNPEAILFRGFLLGLLGARVAFVASYAHQYLATPWQIIDLRDGGFLLMPGLLVLAAYLAWRGWRDAPSRVPLTAAMAAGLVFWGAAHWAVDQHQAGQPMPSTVLHDALGDPVALPGTDSRPMVVNLWASWCPPCRRELPVLLQAQAQHPDIRFVFLNQGELPQTVSNFVATTGLAPSHVLYDPDSQWGRQLGAAALPTTLFYSASGHLLGSHLGELSAASLADGLKVFGRATPLLSASKEEASPFE